MNQKVLKEKKCKNCKEPFQPARPLQMVCGYLCATKYQQQLSEQKEQKEIKIKHKEYREKTKTLTEHEAEAKKSFQKFVRLRDEGGHYFAAGNYSGLIFDERNCHSQCNTYCNKYLSGNLLEYRKGLIKRFGEEFVKQLEADADRKRDYKFTKEELIAKKLQYDLKIKEWKKMK